MAKDAGEIWQAFFSDWPAELPRRGILVTAFDEQVPFDEFAISDDLLLVERRTPDTLGARTVLLAFEHVVAVKITDVVKMRTFQAAGFRMPASRRDSK